MSRTSRANALKNANTPLTTTLLMLESDHWKNHYVPKIEGKVPTVTLLNLKKYPVAAILGVQKTQDEVTYAYEDQRPVPIASFYWAAKNNIIHEYLNAFFSEVLSVFVRPPFRVAEKLSVQYKGVVRINKIVCKGVADSDGNYTRVLERHEYIAAPLSRRTLLLDPAYSHPYRTRPSTTEKVLTTHLIFVYDQCIKQSYDFGEDEKPRGLRESNRTYFELEDIKRAEKAAEIFYLSEFETTQSNPPTESKFLNQ